MKEHDQASLTAPKAKQANSIIPPSQPAINQQTTNHFAETHDDMATIREDIQRDMQSVMSMVQSQQQSMPPSAPAHVPKNGNTSAITLDRTQREMMEQKWK